MNVDVHPNFDGICCYIGSPSSEIRFRVYDKASERGYDDEIKNGFSWTRWEMQLRDSSAFNYIKSVVEDVSSVGETFKGVLKNYFRVVDPSNKRVGRYPAGITNFSEMSRKSASSRSANQIITFQSVKITSTKLPEMPSIRLFRLKALTDLSRNSKITSLRLRSSIKNSSTCTLTIKLKDLTALIHSMRNLILLIFRSVAITRK